MASSAGGMDIEEVAAKTPEKILKEYIDSSVGMQPFQARNLIFGLGLPPELVGTATKFMLALYRAAVDLDASLVEINPFLLTEDGELYALDAKVTLDDNALYGTKSSSSCAISTKRPRSRSRLRSTTSTTSSSMAILPAW
jgi:succinyl-CoA synthetase beta subunit